MGMNIGYLTANKTSSGDEVYTPFYAVDPLLKYIPKDKVIERLYQLEKPFAILLPLNSLQGKKRFKYLQKGIELLTFDGRICYHTNGNFKNYTKGNHFASAYFCKNVLLEKLILEELKEYDRELIK